MQEDSQRDASILLDVLRRYWTFPVLERSSTMALFASSMFKTECCQLRRTWNLIKFKLQVNHPLSIVKLLVTLVLPSSTDISCSFLLLDLPEIGDIIVQILLLIHKKLWLRHQNLSKLRCLSYLFYLSSWNLRPVPGSKWEKLIYNVVQESEYVSRQLLVSPATYFGFKLLI